MTADAANADRRSSDSSKSLLIRTPTQITRAKALVPSEGEMLPPQKRKMRVTALPILGKQATRDKESIVWKYYKITEGDRQKSSAPHLRVL